MKKLGYTDNQNVLVELTNDEYKCLQGLYVSVIGEDTWSVNAYSDRDSFLSPTGMVNGEVDLSPVFKAIKRFALVKGAMNSLKNYVELLEETLREGS